MSDAGRSRTPRAAGNALSYHSPAYWEHRFTTDPREAGGFEWLSSSLSLLSLLPPDTLLANPSPRVLHIGVGTSRLSLDLLKYWKAESPADWQSRARGVVNVDFSERSIEFQKRREREFLDEVGEEGVKGGLMRYEVMDLLNWAEVKSVLSEAEGGFDVVLDKSTTDSISTGEDTPFSLISDSHHHPTLVDLAKQPQREKEAVATTQVLGVNLASVVRKGGLWLCHSYSSGRWDDVIQEGWPWTEVAKTPVPVEQSKANAPQINHWIYTLQRT